MTCLSLKRRTNAIGSMWWACYLLNWRWSGWATGLHHDTFATTPFLFFCGRPWNIWHDHCWNFEGNKGHDEKCLLLAFSFKGVNESNSSRV